MCSKIAKFRSMSHAIYCNYRQLYNGNSLPYWPQTLQKIIIANKNETCQHQSNQTHRARRPPSLSAHETLTMDCWPIPSSRKQTRRPACISSLSSSASRRTGTSNRSEAWRRKIQSRTTKQETRNPVYRSIIHPILVAIMCQNNDTTQDVLFFHNFIKAKLNGRSLKLRNACPHPLSNHVWPPPQTAGHAVGPPATPRDQVHC